MTVANRSPAPTVQNLPDNRSSMSLISRSATPTTLFGGFGLSCESPALTRGALCVGGRAQGVAPFYCRNR